MWFFIWLVTILIPIGSAGYLAFDDPEAVVDNWSGMDRLGAGHCPGVPGPAGRDRHRAGRDLAPSDLLPTASWPLMVLSFTYAIRSLRPSYSGEELTYLPGVSDTVHAIFLVLTALLLLASVVLGVVLSAPGSAQTRDVPRRRMRPARQVCRPRSAASALHSYRSSEAGARAILAALL